MPQQLRKGTITRPPGYTGGYISVKLIEQKRTETHSAYPVESDPEPEVKTHQPTGKEKARDLLSQILHQKSVAAHEAIIKIKRDRKNA